jgi:hypothetical protein
MLSGGESEFNETFYRELIRLRREADDVPEENRRQLQALADQIGMKHLEMQDNCSNIRELADDLCAIVELAAIDPRAGQRKAEQMLTGRRRNMLLD